MSDEHCTDVPESIAGYYYQILLAIRELTNKENDDDAVGIEKGADVRIFIKGINKLAIEAKFYSENFNRNSKPIIHTIYNFYCNLVDKDDSLIFETNVLIEDSLIDEITKVTDDVQISDEQVEYMCISIMKEMGDKTVGKKESKSIRIIDLFRDYLKNKSEEIELKKQINYKHYKYYYDKYKGENIIPFFGEQIEIDKIKLLIKKIRFVSDNASEKYETILKIKEDIKKNLEHFDINKIHYDIAIKSLVDKFLETTIDNSGNGLISLNELKEHFSNLRSNDYNIALKYYNDKFVERIENLDESVQIQINDSYEGEYRDKLFNRYVLIREFIFGEIRSFHKDILEEALKRFTLSNESINTFDELVKFISVFTVFNDIEDTKVELEKYCFNNLVINNEKYLYLEHDRLPSKAVLTSFIRKTVDYIADKNSDDSTVIFSGEITGRNKLCETDVNNQNVLNIAKVNENEQLIKYYKSLKYKCNNCIYFYENDTEAKEQVTKFNNCKGWKSWK